MYQRQAKTRELSQNDVFQAKSCMKLQPQNLQEITAVESLPSTSLPLRHVQEIPSTFRPCPGFETSGFMKHFAGSANQIQYTSLIGAHLRDGSRLSTTPRTNGSVRRFGLQYRPNTPPAWNAVCDLGDAEGDDERAGSGYLGAAID